MTKLRFILASLIMGSLSTSSAEWEYLLDSELSKFEIWMGIPHTTVQGLGEDVFQSDNVHKGQPMGLDADVKNVFSMIEEDGQPVLYISGEIYGGLTTLEDYENYHMSVEMKWGDGKWEPRLKRLRDSGILYHCYGKHGAFWKTWKASLEYQVQETDLGDFIGLGGSSAKIRASRPEGGGRKRFNQNSELELTRYIAAYPEVDVPHGEWNLLEIYTIGDKAVHMVNGEVVMVLEDTVKGNGETLTRGQIQIQSEAAEIYYRDLKIRPIKELPASIRERVRFKED